MYVVKVVLAIALNHYHKARSHHLASFTKFFINTVYLLTFLIPIYGNYLLVILLMDMTFNKI